MTTCHYHIIIQEEAERIILKPEVKTLLIRANKGSLKNSQQHLGNEANLILLGKRLLSHFLRCLEMRMIDLLIGLMNTVKISVLFKEWLLGISCVQSEEKQRIMRFVFKKDAKSALIGRLLIRKVLTEHLRIPYNEVLLKRTEKGKPYLANISEPSVKNFNFNISHQGDYTVLAAEPETKVGVDIMKTVYPSSSTVAGFFQTMRKQFTAHEWQTIKSQESEWKQLEMFYRHWCLKESYVKATGTGIGHDLQSVEFNISTNELSPQTVTCDTQFFLDEVEMDGWRFEETKMDNLHQIAVAVGPSQNPGEDRRSCFSKFTELQFADIVSSAIPLFPEVQSDWAAFESKRERVE